MSQYGGCALHLSGYVKFFMCLLSVKYGNLFSPSRRCNGMPNIKSAKKRVKVNATKAAANKSRKSNLKTILKKAEDAESIRVAIKRVDQACAKGLMHKNKAARKKSQLAKKLNTIA